MIKNYFIIALRNFRKNKFFSLVNISGLAIGISAALVIYLLVQFEFSFDAFRKDGDRIYRVVTDITFPGGAKFKNSGVPMPMPKAVRSDCTGIETVTHFVTTYETKVTVPVSGSASAAEIKKQKSIIYADEFYFVLLEQDWLAGNRQTALKDPYQVVLTAQRAKSYFGNIAPHDIIGKTIIYNDSIKTTVSGIIKDPVEKATDFRFEEFISLATVYTIGIKEQFAGDDWGSINYASQLFVKLKTGTQPQQVNAQFATLREKYRKKEKDDEDDSRNFLQPLADIHFNADYSGLESRQAHKPTLYGLLAVAAFLLLIGCINFINLTTAQAAQRAKEIGIRKTLGSSKKALIIQFLSETFLLTLVAAGLSIILTPWLLKVFSDFLPPEISFASINQLHVWLFLCGLVILMSLFSGFYPALVLTRFKPVAVLKNQLNTTTAQSRNAWFRKSLTITQFVIAQFLVIGTLVVSKQISFSLNKDLGYKKDAIVNFKIPRNLFSGKEDSRRFVLLEKLKTIPGIEKLSLASAAPAHTGPSSKVFKVNNGKKDIEMMVEVVQADPEYFAIYKMKLKAGRLPEQSDTLREYLVNENYTKALGFTDPAEAIGKFVDRRERKIPIVGVLADFNTNSTHAGIGPLAYSSDRKRSYTIHLALKPQDARPGLWKTTLGQIETEYKKLYPDEDFKYEFFDASIAAFYKKEQDIARLLNWSSALCIFISCLGLLGLVIYTTNTRTKEIGVRKVLGASVVQIVSLLSKDLLSLVLVAFIIASPLAWLAMHKWLQDFVYRTAISWWVFAACGAGMLLIAGILLAIRTIKVAVDNPVKSLRTE